MRHGDYTDLEGAAYHLSVDLVLLVCTQPSTLRRASLPERIGVGSGRGSVLLLLLSLARLTLRTLQQCQGYLVRHR